MLDMCATTTSYLITHLWDKRRTTWNCFHYPGRGKPFLWIKLSQRGSCFLKACTVYESGNNQQNTTQLKLLSILGYLLGLFGLFLLLFIFLGLFCLVVTFFLLRAAVALRRCRPPAWPFRWLEVDPSISCPIGIIAGWITEDRKWYWLWDNE